MFWDSGFAFDGSCCLGLASMVLDHLIALFEPKQEISVEVKRRSHNFQGKRFRVQSSEFIF